MNELMRRRRSLMAAQSGGWKGDYAQDGILMWLDGEHNSVDGVHDSNLVRWIDQSGNGYDWNLGGIFEVGSKYIGVSGFGYGNLIAGKNLPSAPLFCEIVLSKTGTINNGGYELIYGCYGNTANLISNIWLGRKNNVDALSFNNSSIPTDKKGVVPNLTGDITYYNSELYANNKKTSNVGLYDSWSNTGKWLFQYKANYRFTGKLYALRLYNRVLTEAEFLRNFAADKKRFGIEVSA